mgnify:CR=1 FL=1
MTRHKRIGSTRRRYVSATSTAHPEALAPGEPAESALVFTEREGLEHVTLSPWIRPKDREFYLEVFGDPSTWRRLDARTAAGRAVLEAQAAYGKAGQKAADHNACVFRTGFVPSDEYTQSKAALLAEYYASRQEYVDAAHKVPVTGCAWVDAQR